MPLSPHAQHIYLTICTDIFLRCHFILASNCSFCNFDERDNHNIWWLCLLEITTRRALVFVTLLVHRCCLCSCLKYFLDLVYCVSILKVAHICLATQFSMLALRLCASLIIVMTLRGSVANYSKWYFHFVGDFVVLYVIVVVVF